MKLRPLGYSGSATGGSDTTSLLVNDKILIDAGTGARKLSMAELKNIQDIVITHSHMDHIAYLPLIADTLFNQTDDPINIYCLKETELALRDNIFNNTIWPDFLTILDSNSKPVIKITNITDGVENDISGITIETVKVNHTVPTLGIRVSDDDHAFAFTGDTTANDAFWNMINSHQKLDLLIAECAFPSKMSEISIEAGHYNPTTLASDLTKMQSDAKIMISHLKVGHEDEIMKELHDFTRNLSIEKLTGQELYV